MHNGKSLVSVFQEFSTSIGRTFISGGGLIFPSLLRSYVLSRLTARDTTGVYHAYK